MIFKWSPDHESHDKMSATSPCCKARSPPGLIHMTSSFVGQCESITRYSTHTNSSLFIWGLNHVTVKTVEHRAFRSILTIFPCPTQVTLYSVDLEASRSTQPRLDSTFFASQSYVLGFCVLLWDLHAPPICPLSFRHNMVELPIPPVTAGVSGSLQVGSPFCWTSNPLFWMRQTVPGWRFHARDLHTPPPMPAAFDTTWLNSQSHQ